MLFYFLSWCDELLELSSESQQDLLPAFLSFLAPNQAKSFLLVAKYNTIRHIYVSLKGNLIASSLFFFTVSIDRVSLWDCHVVKRSVY